MNNFLSSIYSKIIKQSKKNFFFENFLIPDLFLMRLEIFQLNLILILWYMKFAKIKKNNLEGIISFFLRDLELLLRESGEAESRVPRKTRKLVENFYGRLGVYSQQFDLIIAKRKNELKEKLQQNFLDDNINFKKVENYIKVNIFYFETLKLDDFLDLNFDFVSKK